MSKIKLFISLSVLLLAVLACNFIAPTEQPSSLPLTVIAEPTSSSQNTILQSEDQVPRIPLEKALVGLQSGAAVIVDVRSTQAYDASHVQGAVSMPLFDIESNIDSLSLEKDQWIITYCT